MEGLLSIVLPAYNEEKVIEETVSVLTNILVKEKINYELVLVNDGSKDLTWTKIKDCCYVNVHVTGVCFSTEFWQGGSHICWAGAGIWRCGSSDGL